MQQLNQYHQEGNNLESVKAKRINLNLFDDSGNAQLYGRYFFNEYPDLIDKKIVGIKWNRNLGQSQDDGADFDVLSDYTTNNLGYGVYYVDDQASRYLFLNLYNTDKELIIQNLPISTLNQPSYAVNTGEKFGKIPAFDVKLDLKSSYVFVTQTFSPAEKLSLSLTFYYLDK